MDKLRNWLVPVAAIAAVAAVVAVLWYWRQQQVPQSEPTPATAPPVAAEEPGIQHPITPLADAGSEPLPSLDESDPALKTSLETLFGPAVGEYLDPMNVVRRMVSTVDNLTRSKLAVEARPLRSTKGTFLADGTDELAIVSPANYKRYQPLVQTLEMADTAKLIAWYKRFYPLFQEAYVSLGYPSGYFNDRLIAVIDHLLTTPELATPPRLVRGKVFYEFADPALESRSAGQKTLMRMGPENTAAIKRKLREVRAGLAVSALQTGGDLQPK